MKKIFVKTAAIIQDEETVIIESPTTVYTEDNIEIMLFDTLEELHEYMDKNNIKTEYVNEE